MAVHVALFLGDIKGVRLLDNLLEDISDLPISKVVLVDFRASEGCFLFFTADGQVFKYFMKMGFVLGK